VVIVPFQPCADSSRGSILDVMQFEQSPLYLVESAVPLRLAAVGCTLQWTLGAEINKQQFATTWTL